MTTLILPWPPAVLNPNKRVHWSAKSKAAKSYRATCCKIAMGDVPQFNDGKISLRITFHQPDNRLRDDDNMIGSFKSGRDGIADAWGVNDRRFKPTYEFGDVVKGGRVVVEREGSITVESLPPHRSVP